MTGSIHDSVTLCEKNVVLIQLLGGAVGTVKAVLGKLLIVILLTI